MIQIRIHGKNNWLKDAGYSLKEEEDIYDKQLLEVIDNIDWYLNHLEAMPTYRVSWMKYSKRKYTPRYCHVKLTDRRRKQIPPQPL